MTDSQQINIPELCLVALIGPSGSGKSTFARQHFLATEVISSDACRAMVSDDENDQTVTSDAFDILYYIAAKRLAAGKLTVIDATNVRPEDRKKRSPASTTCCQSPSSLICLSVSAMSGTLSAQIGSSAHMWSATS